MTLKKFSQLLMAPLVGCAFFPTTSIAALTTWDFVSSDDGWTTVQGEAFLADNGVTAGQLNGEGGRAGDAGWRGGVNTGGTRNSHDGAHSTLIFRSPVLNFGAASATGSVLEIDWFGGAGKQDGANPAADPSSILDPRNPGDIVAGQTSGLEDGMKGMGLLNLTTGNYDAYSYKQGNGGGTEVVTFTLDQLEGAGVSLTDDYQLDFFENDDGGWGWTRLEAVSVDEAAITGVAPPRLTSIVVSNGTFLSSAIQGSQVGTLTTISGTAGDTYTYSLVAGEGSTDNAKFQIDGGGLQIGPYDFSTTANNTRFSVRVRATGTPSGEQIEKAVLVTALAEDPPLPPGEAVVWDFDANNEHGWTTVQGEAFLADNGVTAGQANGEGGRAGDAGWRGGVNTGGTRNSHDGAHSTLIFRSPVLNFGAASATGSVLEIDWFGGAGKQDGANPAADPSSILDPKNPGDIVAGQTSGLEDGMKGMGLLNLTTGNYDAYSYKQGNGGGTEVVTFTLDQLEGAGVSLTDDYQLDFFENDDGGWGWTRLEEVRVDGSAVTGVAPPRIPSIVVSNGTFLTSAIQGSQVGTLTTTSGTAGDTYTYSLVAGEGSTDNAKFQIDGGELQIGPYDFSTTANNTRFSVRVRATGTPSGEQIEKAVLVTALAEDPPLPPGEAVVWNFDADNEHGWTTVSGEAFLADNGVTAGQANGEGIDGFRGGVNGGANRNAHDGAHTNFIYRSPVVNFGSASATGNVLEIDWFGGEGRGGNVALDPTSPGEIIGKTTGGTEDGVKGLGLLNLTTGNYDAFSYKDGNGGGTQTKTFTLDELTEAGVSLTDSYQLDFIENDDGGWGWTRIEEVRIDPLAIGENSSSTFVITDIDFSSDQKVTLTWNSREGQVYAVKYSVDMVDWDGDLDDSIDADPGDQTTRTFNLKDAGFNGRAFFRVEKAK